MLKKIISLFHSSRDTIKEKYNRVLPFSEYINDRWEKAKYLDFGKNTSIYDSSLVLGDVKVGADCWIGPFTVLDGSGGELVIGNNCNISAGVQIYTHDTVDRVLHSEEVTKEPVYVGDNCYIGPNVVISKGVTIGNNVVVGANSFVNKDIPSNKKVYGNPIKL